MEAIFTCQITAGYVKPSFTNACCNTRKDHDPSGKLLKHGHSNVKFLSQTGFLFTKLLEYIADSGNNQLTTLPYDLKRLTSLRSRTKIALNVVKFYST